MVRLVTQKDREKLATLKDSEKKKLEMYNMIKKEYGGFFFCKYDSVSDVFERDPATGFRFLYVCTFADNDGYIRADDSFCTKAIHFTEIWGACTSTTYKFLNDLVSAGLLCRTDDKRYRITPGIYSMHINNTDFHKNSYRMFSNSIRHLYENSDPREHGSLGEMFRLIPYLNIHHNVLCHNREEADLRKIEPLSKSDICAALRPDSDYGRKLLKSFDRFTLWSRPVLISAYESGKEHYVINPRLLYCGGRPDNLYRVMRQFSEK